MGQTGHLTFFTDAPLETPKATLLQALRLTGAERIIYAARYPDEDREWKRFQEEVANTDWNPDPESWELSDLMRRFPSEDDPVSEIVGRGANIEETLALLGAKGYTNFCIGDCPMMNELVKGLTTIPQLIRRDVSPSTLHFSVGWHDIFEWSENERGTFFGRASFSFQLFSYRSPSNWAEYRRLVFEVPEVKKLKVALEAIVGPMKQCIYWCV